MKIRKTLADFPTHDCDPIQLVREIRAFDALKKNFINIHQKADSIDIEFTDSMTDTDVETLQSCIDMHNHNSRSETEKILEHTALHTDSGTRKDYQYVRQELISTVAASGWANLSSSERDIAIKYFAYDNDTDKVNHLMSTKGMTLDEADLHLIEQWRKHHVKFVSVCMYRKSYFEACTLKYLTVSDANDLFNTLELLLASYLNIGRIGINYGFNDTTDGLMDYVESSHGFVGQGLAENSYTLRRGTWTDFILELKDIIVNGQY